MTRYRIYSVEMEAVIKAENAKQAEKIASELTNINRLPKEFKKHILNWDHDSAEDVTNDIQTTPEELEKL